MMAGEDDEGRNKAATDDMARWVRFARFNTGIEVAGRDVVFQTPWGFGPGAIASAGAQMAAVAYGGQDLMRAGLNIASAGFESFVPLPISKIDPTANPTLFIVDSIMPSVLRPLVQFSANTDGLGRKIYTDRQSRYADAYLGGDNVPEMYKDVVRYMFEATNGMVDMSPGTAYFFANNYVDGASRALATTYNLTDVARGQKEFDIRTDTFLLDSYFKAPANYDAIQFSKAEGKIKELEKRFKALQGSPGLETFLENNPMAPGVVSFYNKTVNGALRNLRAQANYVRRSDMSQKEKNELLQQITKQQNQIKRAFVTAIEGLETGYTGYEE
jgi:arsenate reductase-like glutaredoxin family protein